MAVCLVWEIVGLRRRRAAALASLEQRRLMDVA
jgi:hypothetical protein